MFLAKMRAHLSAVLAGGAPTGKGPRPQVLINNTTSALIVAAALMSAHPSSAIVLLMALGIVASALRSAAKR